MAARQAPVLGLSASSRLASQIAAGPSTWRCSPSLSALSASPKNQCRSQPRRHVRTFAVAEDAASAEASLQVTEGEEATYEEVEYVGNDELLLYFKAEGTLTEAAIPRVIKALEACEGVDNVRVTVLEGCATAECTKTTTVQAAAVSSSLVQALQASGFGLQTVSLGFNDDGSETAADLFGAYTAEGGDLLAETQGPSD